MQNDVVDMLPKHRLEVQLVGRVEVGRDRLRVAVDHDGFVATFFGGQYPVHAAVVEFDALANAVGTAAEHDDFLFVRDHALVGLLLKRAVVVRGQGGEFRGARVHQLGLAAGDAFVVTTRVHFRLEATKDVRDLTVSVALSLGFAQHRCRHIRDGVLGEVPLKLDELLDLTEEPRVNFGSLEDAPKRDAQLERIVHVEQAVPTGVTKALHDGILVTEFAAVGTESVSLDFKRLACLLKGFLKGATNGHNLADGLHLARLAVAAGNLSKFQRGIFTTT